MERAGRGGGLGSHLERSEMRESKTEQGEEEAWNSCYSSTLAVDTMLAEVKRELLDMACDSPLLLR